MTVIAFTIIRLNDVFFCYFCYYLQWEEIDFAYPTGMMDLHSATTSASGSGKIGNKISPWQDLNFSPYLEENFHVPSIDGHYAMHLHDEADLSSFFHFHKFA